MQVQLVRLLHLVLPLVLSGSTLGDELDQPFSVSNENPFVAIYGNSKRRSANVLERDVAESKIGFNVNSNFEAETNENRDSITLDGETEVWDLSYLRGLGNGWEAGVHVPLIKHSGGYLDRSIIRWHDWFGMPQGGRDLAVNDELNYSITTNGTDRLVLLNRKRGVGDVALFVGKELTSNLVLRSQLKLPTGAPEKLMGSGGTDFNVSVDYVRNLGNAWSRGGSASLAYLSKNELGLTNQDVVAALGSHIVYRVKPSLALKVQWDFSSGPYRHPDLEPLTKTAGVLSFGGSLRITDQDRLDLVFIENIPNGEAAPDFGFKLELTRRTRP